MLEFEYARRAARPASSSCARNKNKREKAMKKYLPYLNILGAAACWGCIGLFNRFLMRAGMGAANIVVIRNFGGLVLLTLIFALRERSVFHVKAKHLPIFFGTGVVSMVFFTLCYFKCQELCSLAVSAILLYTAPAMVVLMSAAVFRERITRKKLLALALALLGCSFVTGVWSGDASVTAVGVLFGLGAGFLYALYSIFAPFACGTIRRSPWCTGRSCSAGSAHSSCSTRARCARCSRTGEWSSSRWG